MATEYNVRDFLQRVLPWPVEDRGSFDGYVNLHWFVANKKNPNAKPFVNGLPTQTVNGFMNKLTWVRGLKDTRDIYFCLSTQAKTTLSPKGKEIALRLAEHAQHLKAIWIDLDVKAPGIQKIGPDGKEKDEYDTLDAAMDDLSLFLAKYGLPAPTAIVQSGVTPPGTTCSKRGVVIGEGGGIQVYWTSDRPLTVAEWSPYANGLKGAIVQYGLKCDAGCTGDAARILRVPGTSNWKIDPPRPTRLMYLGDTDLDFAKALPMLPPLASLVTATVTPGSAPFDLTAFPKGSMSKKFSEVRKLSVGCEPDHMPIDIISVAQECSFIKDALVTGGVGMTNPLWNLSTLAATFVEDGNNAAHLMANKHAGYTHESTEELYDRKVREAKTKGLGWPQCKTIHANGWSKCQACPHFAAGKSPLNLGTPPAPKAPAPQPGPTVPAGSDGVLRLDNSLTPAVAAILKKLNTFPQVPGYEVEKNGAVFKIDEGEDANGEPIQKKSLLLHSKIKEPWARKEPWFLHFVTSTDLGNTADVAISMDALATDNETMRSLTSQTCLPVVQQTGKNVRGFFMSLLAQLLERQKAIKSAPFGWHKEDGVIRGFTYGGILFKDNGVNETAGIGDPELMNKFKAIGTIKPWMDSLHVVTAQKRPEFDAIIAASFAAPLMVFTGQKGAMLSVYGETGSGKSSAAKVGMAVWGNPTTTKSVSQSTSRGILNKAGALRHLPLYWDEIQDDNAQAKQGETLHMITEALEAERLTSQIKRQAQGEWQTLMICCANRSFLDFIVQKQRTHAAGLVRVFEIVADKAPDNAPGRVDGYAVDMLMQTMEDNHGIMGIKYAEYLGRNHAKVLAITEEIMIDFRKTVGCRQEERFWAAICGSMLAGALIANILGANLDEVALRSFLIKSFYAQRERRVEEAQEGGGDKNTVHQMTAFFKDHMDQQLWTNRLPGPGNAIIEVLAHPPIDRGKAVNVQWVLMDRKLLISRRRFIDWLAHNKIPPNTVVGGLKKNFGMTTSDATLGARTAYVQLRETVMAIPIPDGSVFEPILLSRGGQSAGALAPVAADTSAKP